MGYNITAMLFFCMLFLMFIAIMLTVDCDEFLLEISSCRWEHLNYWYSPKLLSPAKIEDEFLYSENMTLL